MLVTQVEVGAMICVVDNEYLVIYILRVIRQSKHQEILHK